MLCHAPPRANVSRNEQQRGRAPGAKHHGLVQLLQPLQARLASPRRNTLRSFSHSSTEIFRFDERAPMLLRRTGPIMVSQPVLAGLQKPKLRLTRGTFSSPTLWISPKSLGCPSHSFTTSITCETSPAVAVPQTPRPPHRRQQLHQMRKI